jgi:hypothetical protein
MGKVENGKVIPPAGAPRTPAATATDTTKK